MMPKTPPRLTFAGIALALASLVGGGALEHTTALLLDPADDEADRSAVVEPALVKPLLVAPADVAADLPTDPEALREWAAEVRVLAEAHAATLRHLRVQVRTAPAADSAGACDGSAAPAGPRAAPPVPASPPVQRRSRA